MKHVKKKMDFISNCMLVLLAIVSVGCYYYYTRNWIKKEYISSYYCKINNLKEIKIKNRLCYYFDDIIKFEDLHNILID